MSKDISNIPTSVLMSYQNIVAMANQSMDKFATEIDEIQKQKKLPKDYVEKTNEDLFKKVEANNKIIFDIDQEVLKRLKRDFPSATTQGIMDRLVKGFQKEYEAFNKKADKPKPDLKIKR